MPRGRSRTFSPQTERRLVIAQRLISVGKPRLKWSDAHKYLLYGHRVDMKEDEFRAKNWEEPFFTEMDTLMGDWRYREMALKEKYLLTEEDIADIYRFIDAEGNYREPPLIVELSDTTAEPDDDSQTKLANFIFTGAWNVFCKTWTDYKAELYILLHAKEEGIPNAGLEWIRKEIQTELKNKIPKEVEVLKKQNQEDNQNEKKTRPLETTADWTKENEDEDDEFRIPLTFMRHIRNREHLVEILEDGSGILRIA